MKNITALSFLVCACVTTGCTTSLWRDSDITIESNEEGLQALFDGINGAAIIAKTEAESLPQNPHTALRMGQEKTKQLRISVKRKGE